MPEQITQPIQFINQQHGSSPAKMRITTFTKQEQKSRALKKMMLFWLIAVVCVLIPIAHFFLVPGFLIGGIIAAKRLWNKDKEGIDADGVCPACDNIIHIDLDKNGELPQWHDCPECGDALELQPSHEL